jgi:hypothetical protein
MNIQESLDKIIQSIPEQPIYQILVTKLLQGIWIEDFEDRKYIIVNYVQWMRLEQELCPYLFPNRMLVNYMNIPVYENEDLVKEIMSKIYPKNAKI